MQTIIIIIIMIIIIIIKIIRIVDYAMAMYCFLDTFQSEF